MRFQPAVLALCAVSFGTATVNGHADEAKDALQRKLNNETMSSAFNAGDVKKAQAYAEEAKKQNVPPVAQPPAYWVPGWTCASLIPYAGYHYGDYRNCIYYHHYYGRYWP